MVIRHRNISIGSELRGCRLAAKPADSKPATESSSLSIPAKIHGIMFVMMKPNSDVLRMIFGFSLLMILAGLALAIALGKVEEKTSYGLMPLLTALATLAGGFAQWAFSGNKESGKPDKPEE